jgi:hypothetical protein
VVKEKSGYATRDAVLHICTLRARFTQSNSIIDAIDAYAEGNKLNSHIESYPFDFEKFHV